MIDRSIVAHVFHESRAARTGMELFAVFLGLAIIYLILGSIWDWPPLLSPNGPWPTFVAGLIIIAGHIGYGLYVDQPWRYTNQGMSGSGEKQ